MVALTAAINVANAVGTLVIIINVSSSLGAARCRHIRVKPADGLRARQLSFGQPTGEAVRSSLSARPGGRFRTGKVSFGVHSASDAG